MLYPQYRQYVHTTIVNSVVVEAGRTYWIRRVCLRHVSRASFLSFTLLIARHNEETRLSLRPGRTIINLYYFQANKGTSRPPLDGRVMKTALLLLRHSLIKWRDGREFIIPLSTHILTLHRSHWERQCRCPHFPRQTDHFCRHRESLAVALREFETWLLRNQVTKSWFPLIKSKNSQQFPSC